MVDSFHILHALNDCLLDSNCQAVQSESLILKRQETLGHNTQQNIEGSLQNKAVSFQRLRVISQRRLALKSLILSNQITVVNWLFVSNFNDVGSRLAFEVQVLRF